MAPRPSRGEAPLTVRPGPTLALDLAASWRLCGVVAVLHAGAAACVLGSDLPPLPRLVLALAALASGWRAAALHGTRRAPAAIVAAVWDGHGRWRLATRDGRLLDAVPRPGGFSHPSLVVLTFPRRRGRPLALVITPDMVGGEAYRTLRVRLRCESPGGR